MSEGGLGVAAPPSPPVPWLESPPLLVVADAASACTELSWIFAPVAVLFAPARGLWAVLAALLPPGALQVVDGALEGTVDGSAVLARWTQTRPGLIDTATHLRNGAGGPSAAGIPAIAGYPHLTVPMGQVDGLPIGLSFIGTAWTEAKLLAYGYAYEQASHKRVPPMAYKTATADKAGEKK